MMPMKEIYTINVDLFSQHKCFEACLNANTEKCQERFMSGLENVLQALGIK